MIAPCPTAYGRRNRLPTGIDEMRYYREKSIIGHGTDPSDADIDLHGRIVVGKFIDIERPTYSDLQDEVIQKAFGQKPPTGDATKKVAATTAGSGSK